MLIDHCTGILKADVLSSKCQLLESLHGDQFTFYQIITCIRVPMRCAHTTAVGQCTYHLPWVRLYGEELLNLSGFQPLVSR